MRRRSRLLAAVVASLVALVVSRLSRARERATGVPLSPVTAGRYVGPDFPERTGIADPDGDALDGEMDDMAAYARDGFDSECVHPAVRDFYEHTADYAMTATVTWHWGFRLGAALAARLTSALERLNLLGPFEPSTVRLSSRFVPIRDGVDPREAVRAWVRTDADTGEAVFVALYGSHVAGDERFVNVAVPLPFSNLSTVLRVEHAGGDAPATGIDLTTRADGDPGLSLVTPLGTFDLPLDQRFVVRPTENGITATQTMWVFGVRFLTVEYEATVVATDGSHHEENERRQPRATVVATGERHRE